MKKITTVLIAMLLLTLSVLAAHADQEGNARWCNIDSHGCYLNEEGGAKSYIYFWTEASCRHFMGNDDPCSNVVPHYNEDQHSLPLEQAPEPVVYQQPKKMVIPLEEILELLEEVLEEKLPEDLTTEEVLEEKLPEDLTTEELQELIEEVVQQEELQELIEEVIQQEELPEEIVELLEEPIIPAIDKLYEMAFPKGIYVMKGGLVITDSTRGNNVFTDLQAASASALLIPVYKMSDADLPDHSGVEGITLTDYLQMEVFGSTGSTEAVITTMDNEQQAAILIEDMDRGPDEVTLIGYVPAEAVGVNTGGELNLSAEKLNVISENEEGTELLLGLPEDNGGNTGNSGTINVNLGGQTFNAQEENDDQPFLRDDNSSGTAAWYNIDDQDGALPEGSQVSITWYSDDDAKQYFELPRADVHLKIELNNLSNLVYGFDGGSRRLDTQGPTSHTGGSILTRPGSVTPSPSGTTLRSRLG